MPGWIPVNAGDFILRNQKARSNRDVLAHQRRVFALVGDDGNHLAVDDVHLVGFIRIGFATTGVAIIWLP